MLHEDDPVELLRDRRGVIGQAIPKFRLFADVAS